MKKILVVLIVCFFIKGLSAQNVNIPDANFKAVLVANTSINTNGDTEIQLTEALAFSDSIIVDSLGISNLTGIEAFTSIIFLDCSGNNLTSLNLSQNVALEHINCNLNYSLANLDISQNIALKLVRCSYTGISGLNTNQNLDLEYLSCNFNYNLTSLDLSQNTELVALYCRENALTMLNIKNGNNVNLAFFDAGINTFLACI
jgi:hypothetical protein